MASRQPSVGNILRSNAKLYIAPITTVPILLPDHATVDFGDDWQTITQPEWNGVGYTKSELAAKFETEVFDYEVEESLEPVLQSLTKMSITLEVTLAEFDIENLKLALGGAVTTLPTQSVGGKDVRQLDLPTGGGCTTIPRVSVGFEGKFCGDNRWVRFWLPAASVTMNGDLTFTQKGDDYIGIPVSIKSLGVDGYAPCFQFEEN